MGSLFLFGDGINSKSTLLYIPMVWEQIDPTYDPFQKRGLEQVAVKIDEVKDLVTSALPGRAERSSSTSFDAQAENESSPRHTKITIFVEMIEMEIWKLAAQV